MRLSRPRELLLRWAELCAFSGAVLRTHEGVLPVDNAQVWSDPQALAHFARLAKVFVAFRPYRRGLMREAASRGWPLIRHPVLHYPDDPTLLDDARAGEAAADGVGGMRQFMLGADWMVIPVLSPGVRRRPLGLSGSARRAR